MYTYYEFFAGGGMVRAGLGPKWNCLLANDNDAVKARSYTANWGASDLRVCDIENLSVSDLQSAADLAWASFPCQDLSLAGNGGGIHADRSGTFWPFCQLMEGLRQDGRAPRLVVLENVYGALRSHRGNDFQSIASAMIDLGYKLGPIIVDAVDFVPQSRPRLFVIAVRSDIHIPTEFTLGGPFAKWHPPAVVDAFQKLPASHSGQWIWWNLTLPRRRRLNLCDLIEDEPEGVVWHSKVETRRLIDMMSETNLSKVRIALKSKRRVVGTVYRRTRNGIQRAEIRFDDISGCLRTPGGGSSRQTIFVISGGEIRSRLLAPREAARLMGLPPSYVLPPKYNDAYHLAGDGVVVPVVRFLSAQLLEPILDAHTASRSAA